MKKREAKKYFTNKGVETYEYGWEFDENDFKVGDLVKVCGRDWTMSNYEYPDGNRFAIETITNIDWEKGIITLSNGVNYKQDKETMYLYKGCKEVEYKDRFKSTREVDCHTTVYLPNNYKKEFNAYITPRYLFKYNENEMLELEEKIKNADIEREEKRIAKENKQAIYDKHQATYDAEIAPLVNEIKKLEEQLLEKRCEVFKKAFCSHCKTGCDKRCAYEVYWGHYPDENGMYEYDGEKYRSRNYVECEFFEEA